MIYSQHDNPGNRDDLLIDLAPAAIAEEKNRPVVHSREYAKRIQTPMNSRVNIIACSRA